jgi:hypothetical protein
MQIVILLPLVFFSTTFGGDNKEVDCADNFPVHCLFWGDLENGQGNRKGNEEILDIFSFFVDMDVSWIMQCRIEFILLT